ncbi:hypothetical protein EPYR_01963 [Erwinia pyrifoliae DSM 12163]|nr:hypothetical protein EPYR_01963 [Erwinia pyrifoliae DSM 12163]
MLRGACYLCAGLIACLLLPDNANQETSDRLVSRLNHR